MTTLGLTFLLALVVAWLTAAATSVRTVSRIWLRHWAERQLSGAGAALLYLERPQRLLLAAGTGIAATVFAMPSAREVLDCAGESPVPIAGC